MMSWMRCSNCKPPIDFAERQQTFYKISKMIFDRLT
jgi:hypothetical protein